MNRLATLLLAVPILLLAGCHDNSGTEREIAQLKLDIAQLRDAQPQEALKAAPVTDNRADNLQIQLDRVQGDLAEANKKIAALEARPAVDASPTAEKPQADPDAEYKNFLALDARRRADADAERKKAEETRNAEWARIAKENGIDFDPNYVQGSIRKIMRNPAQMQKAMQAMRAEADKRRFADTGLDEQQIERVKGIESDTRQKVTEAMRAARRDGTPADQVAQQVEQLNKDQESELKNVMTDEQFKKYMDNGGPAAGMIPDLGELIPGMGGRRDR
jgi:hypothetical protein